MKILLNLKFNFLPILDLGKNVSDILSLSFSSHCQFHKFRVISYTTCQISTKKSLFLVVSLTQIKKRVVMSPLCFSQFSVVLSLYIIYHLEVQMSEHKICPGKTLNWKINILASLVSYPGN